MVMALLDWAASFLFREITIISTGFLYEYHAFAFYGDTNTVSLEIQSSDYNKYVDLKRFFSFRYTSGASRYKEKVQFV